MCTISAITMRDTSLPRVDGLYAAVQAAPYVHPRLAAVALDQRSVLYDLSKASVADLERLEALLAAFGSRSTDV
jgi:hypothetical protein